MNDMSLISDGYHTFQELYDHRHELWLALLRAHVIGWPEQSDPPKPWVWRSKLHADGTMFEGHFILGLTVRRGWSGKPETIESFDISYHLPLSYWDRTDEIVDSYGNLYCETLECAPEYDGYTSNDVLERLRKLR